VERFVRRSEPAIRGKVNDLPPRKNPSLLELSAFRVKKKVRSPAKPVKAMNEIIIMRCSIALCVLEPYFLHIRGEFDDAKIEVCWKITLLTQEMAREFCIYD